MNLDTVYNDALNLAHPWIKDPEHAMDYGNGLRYSKEQQAAVFAEHGAMRGYIPSGHAKFDEMVLRTGVNVIYDDTTDPGYPQYSNEIHMPHPTAFISVGDYRRTMAHELSHWTMDHGMPRPWPALYNGFFAIIDPAAFRKARSAEELVAETSAFLIMEHFGMAEGDVLNYHVQYIRAWLENAGAADDAGKEFFAESARYGRAASEMLLRGL